MLGCLKSTWEESTAVLMGVSSPELQPTRTTDTIPTGKAQLLTPKLQSLSLRSGPAHSTQLEKDLSQAWFSLVPVPG